MIGDLASFVSALRAMALPADYSRIHLALGHHLLVAVLAALYVASLWGIGRAAGRWLGLACSRTWRRILLEFFLGAGMTGTLFFGLALPRLWFPAVLHVLVLAGAVSAGLGITGIRSSVRISLKGLVFVAPVMAVLLPLALLPETEMDCLYYHFAVPQQFLLAHGLFQDNISHAFKFVLLGEMLYAWPLVLDMDQVAKLLNLAAAAGAGAAFLAILGGPGVRAAWVALAILLTSFYLFFILTTGKNDVLAFSFSASALLAADLASTEPHREGRALRLVSWLLMGFAVAAKYTYGAMALAVLLWDPVRRGTGWTTALRRGKGAWVMVLPLIPWYLKGWLMFGNPVYFWFTSVFPTLDWSRESMYVLMVREVKVYAAPGSATAEGALARVPVRLLFFAPAILLGAALCLIRGAGRRSRRVALLGLAVGWVAVYFGRIERFATTSDFVMALAAGFALEALNDRLGARARTAVFTVLLLACVPPALKVLPLAASMNPLPYLAGAETEDGFLLARLGPLCEAQAYASRELRPKRLLVDGEWRTYRFRCPIAGTLTMGHPPLVWKMARQSWTTGDVARKFRQLGLSHVACNFITGVYQSAVNEPFPWDARMLRLYRDFVRERLEVVKAPRTVDHVGGGFYMYRVRTVPSRKKDMVFFLPGAMGALYEAREMERRGLVRKAFAAMDRLIGILPDVGQYRNMVGYYWWLLNRHDTAYKLFRGPVQAGMVDDQNWYCFGVSAMAIERYDEAEMALKRAYELYPMRQLDIKGQLATNYFKWGSALYERDVLNKAEQVFALSYASLVEGGMRSRGDHESAAAVLVLRAKALARMGRKDEARTELNKALEVFPDAAKYEDFRRTRELIDGSPRPRR